MPRLEVMGREAVDDRNNLATQQQKYQEMASNAMYQSAMTRIYADKLKLEAKSTDNEAKKMELESRAKDFKALTDHFEWATKAPTPQAMDQRMALLWQLNPDLVMRTAGNKDFMSTVKGIGLDPESQYKNISSQAMAKEYGLDAGATPPVNVPGMVDPITGGGVNLPTQPSQIAAVGGGGVQQMPSQAAPSTMVKTGRTTSFGPTGATMASTYEDPMAKRGAQGITADRAGLAILAGESISNIGKAQKDLFPENDPATMARGKALQANIGFGQNLPTESGQNLKRWITNALAGRLLIMTGVASSPGEREGLYSNFMANAVSNPQATYAGLQELQNFYKGYLQIVKTGNPQDLQNWIAEQQAIGSAPNKMPVQSPASSSGKKTSRGMIIDEGAVQ